MFKLFKKHNNCTSKLNSIGKGEIINLADVKDPVFSQKLMGDGYGFIPKDGKIYAPIGGRINMIPDTKHGIGIKSTNGMDILIHMGIDTVELNGKPFKLLVSMDDEVTAGTPLALMDLKEITNANKSITTMVIITNSKDLKISVEPIIGKKSIDDPAANLITN